MTPSRSGGFLSLPAPPQGRGKCICVEGKWGPAYPIHTHRLPRDPVPVSVTCCPQVTAVFHLRVLTCDMRLAAGGAPGGHTGAAAAAETVTRLCSQGLSLGQEALVTDRCPGDWPGWVTGAGSLSGLGLCRELPAHRSCGPWSLAQSPAGFRRVKGSGMQVAAVEEPGDSGLEGWGRQRPTG